MIEYEADQQELQGWREAERRRIRRTRRTLVGVLVVLIVLLLIASYVMLQMYQPVGKVASQEQAGGVTWVRSIYGWGKGSDQQFWGPQGVGFGPDGTVWVTTQGQNRVVGFNPDGTVNAMLYQGRQDNPHANALGYPVACAVDPSGKIYIADQTKSTVWVMSRDNKVIRKIYVPTPASIAVSSDRLVVGSASGFVIMTPSGQALKVLGSQGRGDKQFEGVRGVAIGEDGTIFAVDQYNNRVSAYDRNGNRKWLVRTGISGNARSMSQSIVATSAPKTADMQIPAGLAVDGAGRLVIADPFGFDLVVLDPKDGHLIAKYGAAGTIDGQFVYPSSVAYDAAHDWFAVADSQNARVQIIRIPGSGGESALASVNRALAGPLRACIIPLLLILLVIIAGIVRRIMRRRKKEREGEAAPTEDPTLA